MKPGKPVISCFAAVTLIVLAIGCKKDVDPGINQDMDLYIQKGKSVVIDLQNSFPGYDKVAVLPSSGRVSVVSNQYLILQSTASDPDSFTFTVVTKNQTRINANVHLVVTGTDPCGKAFTYAKIKKNTKLVVNLLTNPEFCAFDLNAPIAITSMAPLPTDVTVNTTGLSFFTCSCFTTNAVALSYNPPDGFVGQVKSKYYFGIPQTGAAISASDYQNPTPEKWKAVSSYDFVIDVVE